MRYVSHSIPEMGQAYVVSILDNYSRAILASAISLTQDTNAYLSVLHAAIERHGSPGTIVTDGAGVFKANRAKTIYRSLGITKEEIERRQPWQSFIETTFNVQRRMADFHFKKAESWQELVAEHETAGLRATTRKGTGPTKAGRTAGGALRRSSARSGWCATIRRTSGARSSRPASSGGWIRSATPA